MQTADLLLILAGIVGTWIGAELLVRGAAHLALAFGIRPMVVGLTVVALGTSSPEAVASFVAASKGSGALAVGNIFGSNIANIGLILGLVCLLHPLRVNWTELRRDVLIMGLATAMAAGFVIGDALDPLAGALLLLLLVSSLVLTVRTAMRDPSPREPAQLPVGADEGRGTDSALALLRTVLGLGILIAGAEVLVSAALRVGQDLGIAEEVMGATVVAVGTSLPELAASLVAVLRGHHDIGIGNIVGSNVMNLLFVLGGVCVLTPQPVTPEVRDVLVPVTLAFTIALVPMLRFGGRVGRVQGGVLFAGYIAFAVRSFA